MRTTESKHINTRTTNSKKIMNKIRLLVALITIGFAPMIYLSCDKTEESSDQGSSGTSQSDWKCGIYNGHQLWTGPKGGCYYYNSNNNKTYVDRSNCNCK